MQLISSLHEIKAVSDGCQKPDGHYVGLMMPDDAVIAQLNMQHAYLAISKLFVEALVAVKV